MLEKKQMQNNLYLYRKLNLQFFAEGGDDKTEEATPKKLEDARKEGQVAKSREVGMGFSLLAVFVLLKIYVGALGERFIQNFRNTYMRIPEFVGVEGTYDASSFMRMMREGILEMIIMMLPFLAVGFMVAFISDVMQVKWKFTAKPLKPKFSKMNPLKGVKKIISAQSLFEL